jgi:hypothetical protein
MRWGECYGFGRSEMHGGQYDSIAESLRMSVVLVWYGRDVGVRTSAHLTLDYMLGAQALQ